MYLGTLKLQVDMLDVNEINTVILKLLEVYDRKGFVYVFGNGGSASTASHFVNDFNKGVSEKLVKRFKFCCLNDNVSSIMAIANDISYDEIFRFQLKNYLTKNDLVIGISGSGNSKNVVNAIEYANYVGAETIGLVGYDGGKLKELAKYCIHVPIRDMQKVEDIHMILEHLIMSIIKGYLRG
ncbi:SIS domain-containing protein [Ruminiclostridium herbifermentans]|uniref:SIS domain-containing protein n=2 Tax=Ruminiclostridium herbifermentans TaxID=2488810 RepID=A0A4U7JLZ1_9FIRM|nr:SIS domain-containing protein [Ruminiclostridium herbifermentans]